MGSTLVALADNLDLVANTHKGSSQPSIIPISGVPGPPSELHGHQAHAVQRHTCKQNIHSHKVHLKEMDI